MTSIGAHIHKDHACTFNVWAPQRQQVELVLESPQDRRMAMARDNQCYWSVTLDRIGPGTRYQFLLDGNTPRPDPASHYQPDGVHGPSAVVDQGAFAWTDSNWSGVALEDMLLYELHVGTFTPEGTFTAMIPRLAALRELGVTAIELMPVAQFPGSRNWGYDGVFLYAAQDSYGGPDGLKALVNAAHQVGLAVVLDVVYNHLGPEGNVLGDFGPYFTDYYQTPWGRAINFDQAHSHHVREYFIQNALHWLRHYHIDAMRLDAVHAIYDSSAKPIMAELSERVARFSRQADGPPRLLIAESALNDVRVIKPRARSGFGMDAQWSDDFHHSLHALITGERQGYYQDYGGLQHLVKALQEGFVYSWQFSAFRQRYFGSSSKRRPARQLVICSQNHDQIGNRMTGERLNQLVDFETLKLAAGVLLLSPYVPLLFMGQEYGDPTPFQYFVSHSDEALVEAVRQGRQREFPSPSTNQDCPDPQAEETFRNSTLNWALRDEGRHRILLQFYRHLITLRKSMPQAVSKEGLMVRALNEQPVILWQRPYGQGQLQCLMNFGTEAQALDLNACQGQWIKQLDSAATPWEGPGTTLPERLTGQTTVTMPPRSLAVYRNHDVAPMTTPTATAAEADATEEKRTHAVPNRHLSPTTQ